MWIKYLAIQLIETLESLPVRGTALCEDSVTDSAMLYYASSLAITVLKEHTPV